jgi:hypothetical protein
LGCNLSANERFDLDRNDLDVTVGDVNVPIGERAGFSWQWYLVMGYDEQEFAGLSINQLCVEYLSGPCSGIWHQSRQLMMAEGVDLESGKNTYLDVDQDLKLERITPSGVDDEGNPIGGITVDANGVILDFSVTDYQEGDLDFTKGDNIPGLEPGFTKDVNLYSFVYDEGPKGGTYLRIEQGGLFSGDQFVRTTQKKDSVDIIERVFQISNNTGRFCTLGGVVADRENNPVEVCSTTGGGCFSAPNITRTCLDLSTLLIYIRSRVEDLHGTRWVTDRGQDPYVEFLRN